jgi:hypothetical protein
METLVMLPASGNQELVCDHRPLCLGAQMCSFGTATTKTSATAVQDAPKLLNWRTFSSVQAKVILIVYIAQ